MSYGINIASIGRYNPPAGKPFEEDAPPKASLCQRLFGAILGSHSDASPYDPADTVSLSSQARGEQ